jgi:hypothetical protein
MSDQANLDEENLILELSKMLKASPDRIRKSFDEHMTELFYELHKREFDSSFESSFGPVNLKDFEAFKKLISKPSKFLEEINSDGKNMQCPWRYHQFYPYFLLGLIVNRYSDDADEIQKVMSSGVAHPELDDLFRATIQLVNYGHTALQHVEPQVRHEDDDAPRNPDPKLLVTIEYIINFYVDVTGAKPGTSVNAKGKAQGPLAKTIQLILKADGIEMSLDAIRGIFRRHFSKTSTGL